MAFCDSEGQDDLQLLKIQYENQFLTSFWSKERIKLKTVFLIPIHFNFNLSGCSYMKTLEKFHKLWFIILMETDIDRDGGISIILIFNSDGVDPSIITIESGDENDWEASG